MLLKVDYKEFSGTILSINLPLLTSLLALQFLTILLINIQWKKIAHHIGKELPMKTIFHINMMGSFFECITPSLKAGGEAAKIYILKSQEGYDLSNASALVGLQKAVSLLSFFIINLIAIVFLFFSIDDRNLVFSITIGFVIFFFVIFIALYYFFNLSKLKSIISIIPINKDKQDRFIDQIINFDETLNLALKDKKFFIKQLGLATFIWILFGLKAFMISWGIGLNQGMMLIMMITFLAYMAGMIPLLPGGLGTFEGTIILLFAAAGVSGSLALTFAIILRFVTYWFVFIISAIYVFIYNLYKGESIFSPKGLLSK